jgi:hypothetical protein
MNAVKSAVGASTRSGAKKIHAVVGEATVC